VLWAAAAERTGAVYAVQDLTHPGIAVLHSLGLMARLRRPLGGLEANGRQYLEGEGREEGVPDVPVRDGWMDCTVLAPTGLGYEVAGGTGPGRR